MYVPASTAARWASGPIARSASAPDEGRRPKAAYPQAAVTFGDISRAYDGSLPQVRLRCRRHRSRYGVTLE